MQALSGGTCCEGIRDGEGFGRYTPSQLRSRAEPPTRFAVPLVSTTALRSAAALKRTAIVAPCASRTGTYRHELDLYATSVPWLRSLGRLQFAPQPHYRKLQFKRCGAPTWSSSTRRDSRVSITRPASHCTDAFANRKTSGCEMSRRLIVDLGCFTTDYRLVRITGMWNTKLLRLGLVPSGC